MGKKRGKGRSVKRNKNVTTEPDELTRAPHSFVIHRGLPGGHVLELSKDFRKVMEPFTATSLKERKKNAIKDFVSIAGLLHVSHMCIFTHTELGVYLKIARLPRGPTLTFKVHDFCLSRDVVSSLRKQFVAERAFKHSPLIILNSFSGEAVQMKLMATMFQGMFPKINLTSVDLNNIRRCVLLNYNSATNVVDFRHYIIKLAPVGVSKGVKKMVQGKIPNLARCNDISDFLTRSDLPSESEMEDDPNSHVTITQKLISRGHIEQGQSSIKLTELGPRLTLELMKVEEGLLDGEVLFHNFIYKTEEEKLEIQKKREAKRKLKVKRKHIQESNKQRKEDEKEQSKQKSLKGMQGKAEVNEDENKQDDDAEYYRKEVGEEPDKELFMGSQVGSKRPKTFHSYKNKKFKSDADERNKKFAKERDEKNRRRGVKDKTRSQFRDKRPIGGKMGFTSNKRKSVGSKFRK